MIKPLYKFIKLKKKLLENDDESILNSQLQRINFIKKVK